MDSLTPLISTGVTLDHLSQALLQGEGQAWDTGQSAWQGGAALAWWSCGWVLTSAGDLTDGGVPLQPALVAMQVSQAPQYCSSGRLVETAYTLTSGALVFMIWP